MQCRVLYGFAPVRKVYIKFSGIISWGFLFWVLLLSLGLDLFTLAPCEPLQSAFPFTGKATSMDC